MKENGDDGTEVYFVACMEGALGAGPQQYTHTKVWHGSAVPALEKAEAGRLIEPRFSRSV